MFAGVSPAHPGPPQVNFFDEYQMEGVSSEDNEICLEVAPENLSRALKTIQNAKSIKVKLTKKHCPCLTVAAELVSVDTPETAVCCPSPEKRPGSSSRVVDVCENVCAGPGGRVRDGPVRVSLTLVSSPFCPADSVQRQPGRHPRRPRGRHPPQAVARVQRAQRAGLPRRPQPPSLCLRCRTTFDPTVMLSLTFSAGQHLPASSEDHEERGGQDEESVQLPGRSKVLQTSQT